MSSPNNVKEYFPLGSFLGRNSISLTPSGYVSFSVSRTNFPAAEYTFISTACLVGRANLIVHFSRQAFGYTKYMLSDETDLGLMVRSNFCVLFWLGWPLSVAVNTIVT